MLGNILLIVGVGMVTIFVGFILLVARAHKKVPQGKALIRTGFGGAQVSLDSGIFVIPVLHKVEEIDISIKTIKIQEQVKTKHGEPVNILATFFVRVNKDSNKIVEVAQTIGCENAGKQEKIVELFYGKFSEAIHIIASQFELKDLWREREQFKRHILKAIIPETLNGYILDDCAIEKIREVANPNIGQAIFVLLDENKPLEKGEKVVVIDKINDGKSYIVRRLL
jgi:flotillin